MTEIVSLDNHIYLETETVFQTKTVEIYVQAYLQNDFMEVKAERALAFQPTLVQPLVQTLRISEAPTEYRPKRIRNRARKLRQKYGLARLVALLDKKYKGLTIDQAVDELHRRYHPSQEAVFVRNAYVIIRGPLATSTLQGKSHADLLIALRRIRLQQKNFSDSMKVRHNDQDFLAAKKSAVLKSIKELHEDPVFRDYNQRHLAEGRTRLHQSSTYRSDMAKNLRERWKDQKFIEAQSKGSSDTMTALNNDSEFKTKKLEGIKRYFDAHRKLKNAQGEIQVTESAIQNKPKPGAQGKKREKTPRYSEGLSRLRERLNPELEHAILSTPVLVKRRDLEKHETLNKAYGRVMNILSKLQLSWFAAILEEFGLTYYTMPPQRQPNQAKHRDIVNQALEQLRKNEELKQLLEVFA